MASNTPSVDIILPKLVEWFNAQPADKRIIRPLDVPFYKIKMVYDANGSTSIVIGDYTGPASSCIGEATFIWIGARGDVPQTASPGSFFEIARSAGQGTSYSPTEVLQYTSSGITLAELTAGTFYYVEASSSEIDAAVKFNVAVVDSSAIPIGAEFHFTGQIPIAFATENEIRVTDGNIPETRIANSTATLKKIKAGVYIILGDLAATPPPPPPLPIVNSDGTLILTGHEDTDGYNGYGYTIFDTVQLTEHNSNPSYTGADISDVVYSAYGEYVALALSGNRVQIVAPNDFNLQHEWELDSSGEVEFDRWRLAWNKTGKLLATPTTSGNVAILEFFSPARKVTTFNTGINSLRDIDWYPMEDQLNNILVGAFLDAPYIRFYDVNDNFNEVTPTTIELFGSVNAFKFSPSGSHVVLADNDGVSLFGRTGNGYEQFDRVDIGSVDRICWDPTSQYVILTTPYEYIFVNVDSWQTTSYVSHASNFGIIPKPSINYDGTMIMLPNASGVGSVVLHVNPTNFIAGLGQGGGMSPMDLAERTTILSPTISPQMAIFNPAYVYDVKAQIDGMWLTPNEVVEQYPSVVFSYNARENSVNVNDDSGIVTALAVRLNKNMITCEVEAHFVYTQTALSVKAVDIFNVPPLTGDEQEYYQGGSFVDSLGGADFYDTIIIRPVNGVPLGQTTFNVYNWPLYPQAPLKTLFAYNNDNNSYVYGDLLDPANATPVARPVSSGATPFGFHVVTTIEGMTLTTTVEYARNSAEIISQTSDYTVTGFNDVRDGERDIPCVWNESTKTLSQWIHVRVTDGSTWWMSFIQCKFVFDENGDVNAYWSEIAQFSTNVYMDMMHFVPMVDSLTFRHSHDSSRGFVFVLGDGSTRIKTTSLTAYETSTWDITFGIVGRPYAYISRAVEGQLSRYEYDVDGDVLERTDNVFSLPSFFHTPNAPSRNGGRIEMSLDQTKLLFQSAGGGNSNVYGFIDLIGTGPNGERLALLVTFTTGVEPADVETIECIQEGGPSRNPVTMMADNTLVVTSNSWGTPNTITIFDGVAPVRTVNRPPGAADGRNADTCAFLLGNLYP